MSSRRERLDISGLQSDERRNSSDSDDDVSDSCGTDSDRGIFEPDNGVALPPEFGARSRPAKKRKRPVTVKELDVSPDAAAWEKHTKGVGSRLLKKMGFSGRLGLREDGIAAPLTAKIRPEKLGLGAKGFSEKSREDQIMDEVQVRNHLTKNRDIDSEVLFVSDLTSRTTDGRWKSRSSSDRSWRNRQFYSDGARSRLKLVDLSSQTRSPESFQRKSEDNASTSSGLCQSICDLIIRDHSEVSVHEQNVFDVPEVIFNVQVLVDTAAADLENANRRLRTENLLKQNSSSELERLNGSLATCRQELRDLEEIYGLMDTLVLLSKSPRDTRDASGESDKNSHAELLDLLRTISRSKAFKEELQRRPDDSFGLCKAVFAVTEEQIGQIFPKCVDCFVDDSHGTDTRAISESEVSGIPGQYFADSPCRLLLDLLQASCAVFALSRTDELSIRLVSRGVLIPLSRQLSYRWDPTHPEVLVDFLESLRAVIPGVLLRIYAEDVVVPKLLQQVQSWRHDEDSPGLHNWIFPWLPITGRRVLSPVFSECRRKLGSVLRVWKFSVQTKNVKVGSSRILALIYPWKDVWSKSKLAGLLIRYVVPSLQFLLKTHFANSPAIALVDLSNHSVDGTEMHAPQSDCGHDHADCVVLQEVLQWRVLLQEAMLTELLMECLFPFLCDGLQRYLFSSPTHSDDVQVDSTSNRSRFAVDWYLSWKGALPQSLRHSVLAGYASLLFMIHAFSLVRSESSREILLEADTSLLLRNSYSKIHPGIADELSSRGSGVADEEYSGASRKHNMQRHPRHSSHSSVGQRASFKEAVRSVAEASGLSFVPSGSKSENGQAVFLFGEVPIYLDGSRQILFANLKTTTNANHQFTPLSISELVKEARRRQSQHGSPT